MSLVKAYRTHGHLNARLDPLGSEPMGDPALDETRLEPPLTPELQARIPAKLLRLSVPGETLLEALPHLREVYTGTIAYEIEHISDHAERVWLRQAIETGRFRGALPAEERRALLERLAQVEAFETYLRRAFIGQKQFSIEGLDVLVPMLDEAVELAARSGAHEVLIGIAHRGRLNVLTHVVGRSYTSILREFEGERSIDALISDPEGGTGDVKYHLAASESRVTDAGEIQVTVASNPSHLEAVDPVVEGLARAEQTDRSGGAGIHDPTVALPVLIHGDASFAGQGVVAETFNLHSLDGYSTGGTLHLIANNQVGLHDRSRRGPFDAVLERPREGLRRPDHPRQRRRPRGRAHRDPARARVSRGVRPRRRGRPRRLPAVRPQRAGRGVVHAAAAVRAHRAAGARARVVRRAAGGGGCRGRRTTRPACSRRRSRSSAPRTTSSARASRRRSRARSVPTKTDTGAAVVTAVAPIASSSSASSCSRCPTASR